MKTILLFISLSLGFLVSAQSIDYNTKKGYAAEGYDVVSYFNKEVKKGNTTFTTTHDDTKYKFANQKNLETFKANPDKFKPQYGGYCAYAVALNAEKISVDPETYEIRDGKLYLFYNSWGNNTLKSWLKESPDDLKKKGDMNWEKIKYE